MSLLESLKIALLPRALLSKSDFLSASATSLAKEAVTSQITYFGIAGVAVTLIHKFAPKIYMKLHRYTETRQLLEYATPWPLIRSLAEYAIEYGLCAVAHRNIPWFRETFPTPMHGVVAWNSGWSSLMFSKYLPFLHNVILDRDYMKEIIVAAPASVIALTMMPSGNDIGTIARPFYDAARGKLGRPFGRVIVYESVLFACRSLIAFLTGETAVMVENSAWGRLGVQTIWFCLDIFAVRAVILPRLCDMLVPIVVDGQPLEQIESDAARPFVDEEEEKEARMMLLRITAEQMRTVSHFCYEIILSDHARGSVKVEAARLMRYATLLEGGTSNEGVNDLEDVGRVASVYEHNTDELDTHGVDEEHRTCAICLEEFEKSDKVATIRKCKHTFHYKCGEAWWSQHNNCPVCRGELLREGSGDNDSFGRQPDAARQQQQVAAGGGAAGGDAEAQQQQQANQDANALRDLNQRLFRHMLRCQADEAEWEWGPLRVLFYTIGNRDGLNAVRELMVFDSEQQFQASSYDLWHVLIVNLLFALPNWDA